MYCTITWKMFESASIICILWCLVALMKGHPSASPSPTQPSPPPPSPSPSPSPSPTPMPHPPWACDVLPELSPWDAPAIWWDSDRGHFVQLHETVDDAAPTAPTQSNSPPEALRLRAVALLNPVAQRIAPRRSCSAPAAATTAPPREDDEDDGEAGDAGEDVVQVCVALVDATAYSSVGTEENVAWATLHADSLAPAAVLEVDAGCYMSQRSASHCRPCLLAPESLRRLPLWHASPLREDFWRALDAAALPAANAPASAAAPALGNAAPEPWLRRINAASRKGRSVDARWLALPRLPALRGLELTGNAWDAAPPPPLPAMPWLTELRLHDNAIAALPEDFFTQTPRLEHVILARNSLVRLPKSIANLKMLTLLDVTNPIEKGQSFYIDNISQLPNLQILGLENQEIIGDVMPILSMPSLAFLNMSGCGLKTLGIDHISYSNTTDLQVLDLSNNHLGSVPNTVLSKFPKLVKLLLNGNELRILGHQHLLNSQKLVYLDVSQNHLKYLPSFLSCSHIKILKVRDNVLENFSEKFWESCSILEILDLSQNHLQSVPLLKNQENLQVLDLSNNEIKTLQGSDFGPLKHLKSLDISNNLLSVLDPKIFTDFMEIKIANFSNNKLWFVSLLSNSLETLDLNYNVLTSLPELYTPSLSQIMLTNNLITIANFSLINASKLQDIDLRYNKITLAYLNNNTIENVDLSHNKLQYPPFSASYVNKINLLDNPLNGDHHKDNDSSPSIWDSWFVWVLVVIAFLALISFLILLGLGIWLRKSNKQNVPLLMSSTIRSSSPVSLNVDNLSSERFR